MRKLILLFLFSSIFQNINSQIIWSKIYKYTSATTDGGKAISEFPNGDIIVSGGNIGSLIRLKSDGSLLWRKSFKDISEVITMQVVKDFILLWAIPTISDKKSFN